MLLLVTTTIKDKDELKKKMEKLRLVYSIPRMDLGTQITLALS